MRRLNPDTRYTAARCVMDSGMRWRRYADDESPVNLGPEAAELVAAASFPRLTGASTDDGTPSAYGMYGGPSAVLDALLLLAVSSREDWPTVVPEIAALIRWTRTLPLAERWELVPLTGAEQAPSTDATPKGTAQA